MTAPGRDREVDAGQELAGWQEAGLLGAADVHVARRLAALIPPADPAPDAGTGDPDGTLDLLGAAFAVRAVRLGHVCVDLRTVAATATSERDEAVDLDGLPWPDPEDWIAALHRSPLVAVGDLPVGDTVVGRAPLRLVGGRCYLDRYWRQEVAVAEGLTARAERSVPAIDGDRLADGLTRLFPPGGSATGAAAEVAGDSHDRSRAAAVVAVTRRLCVLAGGPGTGKTTAVARILALLDEQAEATGSPPPRVALAAPTGKAAARLAEAVHGEARHLDTSDGVRARLLGHQASTLHRLLGWRPDSQSRFRHDRTNRLPHDVVVVDETSMLSLSLMAKLLDAVLADARLVLVGDPGQLASVEAGAVLGDVVGPAAGPLPPPDRPIARSIVHLDRIHRFGGGVARLAKAVAAGDGDQVVGVLAAGLPDVGWVQSHQPLDAVDAEVSAAGVALIEAAQAGRGADALDALGSVRVLCAHRHGPAGVGQWNERVERLLAVAVPGYGIGAPWYPGRPLLVTANDHELQLYNGDTGVIVAAEGRRQAVFWRRGERWSVSPSRLRDVETVHAMTVHKSQGSQFGRAVVVLPPTGGGIVTRELLYTAVTRARERVTVVGDEEVVRAAVARPVGRASGLGVRLWGD